MKIAIGNCLPCSGVAASFIKGNWHLPFTQWSFSSVNWFGCGQWMRTVIFHCHDSFQTSAFQHLDPTWSAAISLTPEWSTWIYWSSARDFEGGGTSSSAVAPVTPPTHALPGSHHPHFQHLLLVSSGPHRMCPAHLLEMQCPPLPSALLELYERNVHWVLRRSKSRQWGLCLPRGFHSEVCAPWAFPVLCKEV